MITAATVATIAAATNTTNLTTTTTITITTTTTTTTTNTTTTFTTGVAAAMALQKADSTLLGVSTKLRKVTISFVVCPSVRPHEKKTRLQLEGFS
jgi:hypothetical protein